ncbi:hypothetical protein WN943_000453 [Citrus x changshan-huyou]
MTNPLKDRKDGNQELMIEWKRVARTSFGFRFVGPVGHFWHEGLDRFIRKRLLMQPNSLRFVAATKVGIDGLLFGPLNLLTFFPCTSFAAEKFFSSYGRLRTSAVSTPPTPSACRIAVFCHGSSNKRMLLGSNGLYIFYLQWNKKAMGDHENYSYTHCFQSE